MQATDKEKEAAFKGADRDRSGQINWEEFRAAGNKLKKLVYDLDKFEKKLRAAFTAADEDGSGFLNKQEFYSILTQVGLAASKKEKVAAFKEADKDGEGQITWEVPAAIPSHRAAQAAPPRPAPPVTSRPWPEKEFRAAGKKLKKLVSDLSPFEKKLWAAFCNADEDGSGFVDREEFYAILEELGVAASDEAKLKAFNEADRDRSGKITWEEFVCSAARTQTSGSAPAVRLTRPRHTRLGTQKVAGKKLRDLGSDAPFEKKLWAAFNAADEDGSGFVSRAEFEAILDQVGLAVSDEEKRAAFNAADKDRSDEISWVCPHRPGCAAHTHA